MKISTDSLYIETKIAGITSYSLIDTGANTNAINEAFLTAKALEYKTASQVTVIGVFGKEKRSTYHPINVELFGNETEFTGLVGLNMGADNVQLILGGGLLSRFVFQFDYPNSRMRVFDRESADLKKTKNIASRTTRAGELLVKMDLNKQRNAWLLLDTGNSIGLLLNRIIVVQKDWITTYPSQRITGYGVTSNGEIDRFNILTMQIGPFEIENPIVAIPP